MQDNTWEQFYKLYAPAEQTLYQIVYRIVKEKGTALDVMQNVAAIGMERFEQLQKKESFNAWISCIATSEAYFYCRRRNRRDPFLSAIEPKGVLWLSQENCQSGINSSVVPNERNASIREAIQQLELLDQQILYMRLHLDMKFSEIAKLTQLTPAAVKVRLNRVFHRLRKEAL